MLLLVVGNVDPEVNKHRVIFEKFQRILIAIRGEIMGGMKMYYRNSKSFQHNIELKDSTKYLAFNQYTAP